MYIPTLKVYFFLNDLELSGILCVIILAGRSHIYQLDIFQQDHSIMLFTFWNFALKLCWDLCLTHTTGLESQASCSRATLLVSGWVPCTCNKQKNSELPSKIVPCMCTKMYSLKHIFMHSTSMTSGVNLVGYKYSVTAPLALFY